MSSPPATQAAHADVLHRNVCSANITELALSPGSPALSHTPYVRWLSGSKAVLVLANAAPSPAAVGVFVPLDTLGMGGAAFLDVTILYGGQGGVTRYAAGARAV